MRVIHVMASGERGGGADHLVGLLPELRARGIECVAVVGESGPLAARLEVAGFPVETLPLMGSRLDPRTGASLRALVRSLSPELVHCHGTRAAFHLATGRRPAPTVYTIHGLSYRQSGPAALRAIRFASEALNCRRLDQVVSVSAADIDDLHRRRALAVTRGVHIPNAIDHLRFRPRDRAAARARLGLTGERPLVGTVARLVPQKAVADLVQAMAAVPDADLVVVGDGPLRAETESLARRLRVTAQVLGSRDDVEEILPAFDVFVLPSLWEGEPIALLEAMATGLACVATANSGNREIIEDGRNGLLVPLRDPTAMGQAIRRLLDDGSLATELSKTARAAVAGRTWANAAASLESVYREVLARA